jgi:hypothetical protein
MRIHPSRHRRAALVFAAFAAVPAAGLAQPAKSAPPARIEFRAMGDEGQVVADLKPADVSLKVNGKARPIQTLSLFRAVADTPAGPPLPPPYSTNVVAEHGRVVYVLLDDTSISPGREAQVKDAVRMLVSELSPTDRLGVLSTEGTINVRPGSDFIKVRSAVDAFGGRAGTTENDTDSKCRTKKVIGTLGTMLSVSAGTHPTIVVFSSGLSVPETKRVVIGSGSTAGTSDLCPVEPDDFSSVGKIAAVAAADVYLFQLVDGLSTHVPALDVGYESLAGVTGGTLLRLQGNPQPGVTRLLRETAAYYVATFAPDASERNGQPLRVELKAATEKVKLRGQSAIMLPKDAAATGAPAPKDLLRVATEYSDLPLRATSYASRMTAGDAEVRVMAFFESVDGAPLSAASVGMFDEKGTLKKQWTAQKDDLAKPLVRADLQAPPGTYRVRVAAVDTSGRAGTTDYELKAETVRADPLRLSALVLGTQLQGENAFQPRIQFTNEAAAIGMLEVYDVPNGGTVTVDLDVASSSDGQPLATAETRVAKGSSDDAVRAIGGFGIDTLPPGDYLMRAIVKLNGTPVGRVMRTLRKAK